MKVRKIVAGLAAVSMLAVATSQAVFAADALTIAAGETTAKAGEEFTLNVELSGVPASGVAGLEFALEYDASVITITDAKAGEIANTGVDDFESFEGLTAFMADYSQEGSVVVSYSTGLEDSSFWISKDGVFLTLTGTVSADAAAGKYDVKVVGIGRPVDDKSDVINDDVFAGTIDGDGNGVEIATAVKHGSVTVKSEGSGEDDVKWGDVNVNGEVDVADVIDLCKATMGAFSMTDQGAKNADVDQNGSADTTDASYILQSLIGLVTLPVSK